jgi:hypothetical protein
MSAAAFSFFFHQKKSQKVLTARSRFGHNSSQFRRDEGGEGFGGGDVAAR